MATPMSAVEHDPEALAIKSEATTLGEDKQESADGALDVVKAEPSN